jgi:hypothetical protein
MPAKVRINDCLCYDESKSWIPACAGMSGVGSVGGPILSAAGVVDRFDGTRYCPCVAVQLRSCEQWLRRARRAKRRGCRSRHGRYPFRSSRRWPGTCHTPARGHVSNGIPTQHRSTSRQFRRRPNTAPIPQLTAARISPRQDAGWRSAGTSRDSVRTGPHTPSRDISASFP